MCRDTCGKLVFAGPSSRTLYFDGAVSFSIIAARKKLRVECAVVVDVCRVCGRPPLDAALAARACVRSPCRATPRPPPAAALRPSDTRALSVFALAPPARPAARDIRSLESRSLFCYIVS
ncbi:hypothetical protein EVAR_9020_1 [Eumeta japonica]|uniref:Uncharacterized protein n=1 Tax=Eumeta variegata TaxID=151549 RepID=A0A4C1TW85_EUMVA|nr:hypothetical protein EVAR_9020_1 [Eumeta japonica]